ncbi:toxin-antitoxin system HicB family antitoxin [Rhodococcus opacus]|nr:toxin-antitoxin system HicB family antitoxin [Rhodococcus opacus]
MSDPRCLPSHPLPVRACVGRIVDRYRVSAHATVCDRTETVDWARPACCQRWLKGIALTGEQPPVPDRPYRGKFKVCTSPQVHRALAVEAEEQGVSLNLLVNQKPPLLPSAAPPPIRSRGD